MEASPFRPLVGLLCSLIVLSCESKKEGPPEKEPARAPSTAPSTVQQEPVKPEVKVPWFVGSWQGRSELGEELSVEDQDATERGERVSGQVLGRPQAFQLHLTVTAEDVSGAAELGEHKAAVSGVLLDESLRLNFRGDTLQGMWSGVRGEQAAFSGTVRASTTKTVEGRERVQRYSGLLKVGKVEEVK